MKKLTAPIITLILTIALSACGGGENTPDGGNTAAPPPETGVSALSAAPPAKTSEQISVEVTAANVYVLNVDSGSALYEKNSGERIAPASTAKMLTALTVLDYCSVDDTFTVGSEIGLIAEDSSVAGLVSGDTMTVRQLLTALMICSGNDAAYTLAVNAGRLIAGESGLSAKQAVKAFAGAMNQKAKDVGASSSHFVTPDGYDADGQYTTAFDLAQIAKACLENAALAEIVRNYKINDTLVNGREVTYINSNKLLNPDSPYYYPNAVGLKTGTTGDAGACLISAAVINGQTYISVVMGSSEESRFSDSISIFSEIDPALSRPEPEPVPAAPGGPRTLPRAV